MTQEQFTASLSDKTLPDNMPVGLQAMWYDAGGDWQRAHELAQEMNDDTGSWIHAYLHRKEGDAGNAAYWYRRARRPVPAYTLEREQQEMISALLG